LPKTTAAQIFSLRYLSGSGTAAAAQIDGWVSRCREAPVAVFVDHSQLVVRRQSKAITATPTTILAWQVVSAVVLLTGADRGDG